MPPKEGDFFFSPHPALSEHAATKVCTIGGSQAAPGLVQVECPAHGSFVPLNVELAAKMRDSSPQNDQFRAVAWHATEGLSRPTNGGVEFGKPQASTVGTLPYLVDDRDFVRRRRAPLPLDPAFGCIVGNLPGSGKRIDAAALHLGKG
jgi:hypothetical protein